MGMLTMALGIIVVMFFDKYRGIACGIKFSGFSLSPLVFAKILVPMKEVYEFRGTLLLCGAIMTHATVLAFLLRKPLWMTEKPNRSQCRTIPETMPASHAGQAQTISASIETSNSTSTTKQNWGIRESLSSIRKPMFYVIVIYSAVTDYSETSFLSTIVDYAMDKGSSLNEAQSLVLYFSVAQLLGRILLPLISDLRFLKRSALVTISVILLGCTFLSLPHMTSFSYLVPACLLAATLIGCVTSMETVLMADYLGVDAISLCWVGDGAVNLPLYLCSSTILGRFRDSMGSYDNVYRLLAGIQFFVGLMFFLVCCYENRKVSKNKSTYTVNR
ncbi:unnamed protein product [Ixodes pacificus]